MSPYKTGNKGLYVTSYTGDGAVLLAFDLDLEKTYGLAGFAIKAKTPDKGPYPTNEYWLKNRLSFKELTSEKALAPEKRADSSKAPFQTFHWIHYPGAGPGRYTYTVFPCYFKDSGGLDMGPGVPVDVDLNYRTYPDLELAFTRGYISSQAYVDLFHNAPIRPEKRSVDFDESQYEKYERQYKWLGAHARELIFKFLRECQEDPTITLDVFTYDLDEPDLIRNLAQMGPRVRVFQDNACLHVNDVSASCEEKKEPALEPYAIDALKRSGVMVKTGKFHRYAHNKVMIQKKSGKPVKVLTGSANFSVRGLYVQANSVLVFEDPAVAGLYERAFEQAYNDMGGFRSSDIASGWFEVENKNMAAPISFGFAPHKTAFTLENVSRAIRSTKSSVFFAIMVASKAATGPVIPALKGLGDRGNIFSIGTVDMKSEIKLFKQGKSNGVAGRDYLDKNVPEPFRKEWGGGRGRVIHHKFVVCDFNDTAPSAFCGSSNLAAGGEVENGDNLIAIHDPAVVYSYAVEAIRLYDHYRFRCLHAESTSSHPLMLDTTDGWVKRYYDPENIKFYERKLFGMSKAGMAAPAAESRA